MILSLVLFSHPRPRWRLALGGAQLDPATPVAQLTVEDLVKLCNALGELQTSGEKKVETGEKHGDVKVETEHQ